MSQIKTITYKRILNLGNYETKALEMSAELEELDHPESVTRNLVNIVENMIREPIEDEIKAEIADLQEEYSRLSEMNNRLKKEIEVKQEKSEREF